MDLVYVHTPNYSEILKIISLFIKPPSRKKKVATLSYSCIRLNKPSQAHHYYFNHILKNFSLSELVSYQLISKTKVPRT